MPSHEPAHSTSGGRTEDGVYLFTKEWREDATWRSREDARSEASANKLRDKAINYKDKNVALRLSNRMLRQQEAFSGGDEALRSDLGDTCNFNVASNIVCAIEL